MTTAVSEILTQTELLSAEEQLELATRLMEQARQNADATPHNGLSNEVSRVEPSPQLGEEERASEEEVEEGLDVFSLNHVPPKDSYVVMMKFVDAGRGEPTRYDFSGIFDDEEEEGAA